MSDHVGRELGSYRVEAVLGRGGMGVVYLAQDLRLGRRVALKVLAPNLVGDERLRRRFLSESRLAASIDHANIVPIYEAGEVDGELFIAMRYVEGTDLARVLRAGRSLEPRRAVALVEQLAAALDAAHAHGLLHRDVKPSNALIVDEGRGEHVYLADFGLTKDMAAETAGTASDQLVGTVAYLAPERIGGAPADGRADVYSLGCVLFECLTGEVPFPRDSDVAAIYAHLEEPPPRVGERGPGVPAALDEVVARALAKDPADRWQTAGQLAAAASAALQGERPAHAPTPRRRRPALLALGAVAALLVAALLLLVVRGGGGTSTTLAVPDADSVAVIDPGSRSLLADVALRSSPSSLAVGAGSAWIANVDASSVSQVDLRSRAPLQTIPVGDGPAAVAVGAHGVWVANRLSGTLSWISPQTDTVVDEIPIGNAPSDVCVAGGAVWVVNAYDQTLVRFDPVTRRRTTVTLDDPPTRIACAAGSVWVTSEAAGNVTQIDATTAHEIGSIPAGRGASGLAAGAGALWVANTRDATVSRIDPRRAVQTAVITMPSGQGLANVAVGAGGVWVSNPVAGTLERIDPTRQRVAQTLHTGNRPDGLAVVDGSLWVSVRAIGAQHRGGTLRILEPTVAPGQKLPVAYLDPANYYYGWDVLPLTNDGLDAFRRVGGGQGEELVPDLAVSIPTPTDGGRTYAFQLRPGVRYSTGAPVRASDIRHGIERVLLRGAQPTNYYTGIRGARRCTARPARCDLSSGISVDNAAGTITFHLTAPDPDFKFKLALPGAVAVPQAIGPGPLRRPLPATGPYRVDRVRHRATLELVRNPHFRPVDGRPDGYADTITINKNIDLKRTVRTIERGRADLIGLNSGLPGELRPSLDTIATRYAGQLHTPPGRAIAYAFLNTHMAPFDNVDVRRALNYAVNRSAFVALKGGQSLARPTCQILPANSHGYRPYCPYTAHAGPGRPWSAPDLARAQALVDRSHTRGMHVAVVGEDYLGHEARLVVKLLKQLGYHATLRGIPKHANYFTYIADSRHRAQIGVEQWVADYPGAAGYLQTLFSCAAFVPADPNQVNVSQFCDPQADRLMQRARRLPAGDPRADALWARADQRIVNQAAAVPLTNPDAFTFVSPRVGNYQYSSQWGVLYDQLWVR